MFAMYMRQTLSLPAQCFDSFQQLFNFVSSDRLLCRAVQCFIDVSEEVSNRIATMSSENGTMSARLPPLSSDTYVVGRTNGENSDSGVELLDLGSPHERGLRIAAIIASEIRENVFRQCEYTCSAGVAGNKMLAKFASAENKPNKQTVIPHASVNLLLDTVPLRRFRGCGGKIGKAVEAATSLVYAGEIREKLSIKQLEAAVGERSALFVWNVVRGKDDSSVIVREQVKTLLAAKNFEPTSRVDDAVSWLRILARELVGRMDFEQREHHRSAKSLSLSFRIYDCRKKEMATVSRTQAMPSNSVNNREYVIVDIATSILNHSIDGITYRFPLNFVGLTASGFTNRAHDASSIMRFLSVPPTDQRPPLPPAAGHQAENGKITPCEAQTGMATPKAGCRIVVRDIASYLHQTGNDDIQRRREESTSEQAKRLQEAADHKIARQLSRDEFARNNSSVLGKRKPRVSSSFFTPSKKSP
jgi:nucleotidyltransferase/DNA polymerase involved in DNA repair